MISFTIEAFSISYRYYAQSKVGEVTQAYIDYGKCAGTYGASNCKLKQVLNFSYFLISQIAPYSAGVLISLLLIVNKEVYDFWKTLIFERRIMTDQEDSEKMKTSTSATGSGEKKSASAVSKDESKGIPMDELNHVKRSDSKTKFIQQTGEDGIFKDNVQIQDSDSVYSSTSDSKDGSKESNSSSN